MSHFDEIHTAITKRFQDEFKKPEGETQGLPGSFIPIQFDGHPFTAPKESPWGRFHIVEGERNNAAVGKKFQRAPGLVYLQIFLPENAGVKQARITADKFAEIFDNYELGGDGWSVLFRTVSLNRVGKTKEGPIQFNAVVQYQADESPEV